MNSDELTLTILRKAGKLESQRHLAGELGMSVGKANYVIRELVKKGLLKTERFAREKNIRKYRYLLTSKGLREKIRLTELFIERKKREYEELVKELEIMKRRKQETGGGKNRKNREI